MIDQSVGPPSDGSLSSSLPPAGVAASSSSVITDSLQLIDFNNSFHINLNFVPELSSEQNGTLSLRFMYPGYGSFLLT